VFTGGIDWDNGVSRPVALAPLVRSPGPVSSTEGVSFITMAALTVRIKAKPALIHKLSVQARHQGQ